MIDVKRFTGMQFVVVKAFFLLFMATADSALAAPNLALPTVLGDLRAYPDDVDSNRYYYVPKPMLIAQSESGRPAMHLLVTRYLGTRHAGDQGEWVNRNILSVRFRLPVVAFSDIKKAKQSLISQGLNNVRLGPLPLYAIEGAIQYTAVDSESVVNLPSNGFLQGAGSEATASSLWSERTYSLSLGPQDAQILLEAMNNGSVALSFSYAYFAKSAGGDQKASISVTGSAELVDALQQRVDSIAATTEEKIIAVHADAIAITVDASDAEFHITKLDINDRLPPGYASLDIYCYDFQQDMVAQQYAKNIEIKAQSPTGKTVKAMLSFTRATPEIYAQSLNIPFAVKFSAPFQYRVVSIYETGQRQVVTPWTERSSWAGILDISNQSKGE